MNKHDYLLLTGIYAELLEKLPQEIDIDGMDLEIDWRYKKVFIGINKRRNGKLKSLRKQDPLEIIEILNKINYAAQVIEYFKKITKRSNWYDE